MRTVDAKAQKTGSMRLVEDGSMKAKAGKIHHIEILTNFKCFPAHIHYPSFSKILAEKTSAEGGSMRLVETKAQKHTPEGSMSMPAKRETPYQVFSKASL
jgi:hypothetical protein